MFSLKQKSQFPFLSSVKLVDSNLVKYLMAATHRGCGCENRLDGKWRSALDSVAKYFGNTLESLEFYRSTVPAFSILTIFLSLKSKFKRMKLINAEIMYLSVRQNVIFLNLNDFKLFLSKDSNEIFDASNLAKDYRLIHGKIQSCM